MDGRGSEGGADGDTCEEDSQQEKRTTMHAACGDALMTSRRGAVRRLFARAVGVGAAACLEAEGQWAPYSKKLNLGCIFRRQVNDEYSGDKLMMLTQDDQCRTSSKNRQLRWWRR